MLYICVLLLYCCTHFKYLLYKTISFLGVLSKIIQYLISRGLPRWYNGQESAYNAGDPGSIPGLENPLEEKISAHPSILAWEIPQRSLVGYSSWGHEELDTAEHEHSFIFWDFPGGSDGKASAYNAGDLGSIPGLGRSPGEGNDNPLQYSCLENPMDTVHRVAKSGTRLNDFTFTFIQYLKSQSWRKNNKNVRFGILWEELKLQKWYLAGQLSQSGFGDGNDSIKYDIGRVSRYGSYQKELAWKEYLLIWNEESTGFWVTEKWEINLRWSLRFYMTDDNVSVIMVMQIIHRVTDRISVKWGKWFLF